MAKVTPIHARKDDHLRINLEEEVRSALTSGLEDYHFEHRALPELDLEAVDTRLSLFGRALRAPLLISSMTGGSAQAKQVNLLLAKAAQDAGIAMGLGSQRIALEHPELAHTFQVRGVAPDILLFANLGAVQLNYGYDVEDCQRAVEMVQADALVLHFNALQEAVQPEGQTRFAGLLAKVEKVCRALSVPVIAKEVGWGFSEQDARLLREAGVAAIDVAGAGGTSWSQVELHRAQNEQQRQLAQAFVDWGIPTSQAILNVRRAAPEMLVFASGGLRDGVDLAKCIALGATLGGMAGPLLRVAMQAPEQLPARLEVLIQQLRVCMFAAGARTLEDLRRVRLIERRKDAER